ncbi:outer membrane beta-barrel protein [Fulvivirga sp. M361]|uniref:outer membrane beta-barrel protein n=1 Tax=Fulvivirga sp. M361 TaxID=2594266 RepID=UPI0016285A81|nr:outer membrane beta-barrel protein [Fulvivirga sp. M361]
MITLENDTIQGQLDYRSNSKNYESCIFKGEQGRTEYYPNQILGFGYNNDKFFSAQRIKDSFVEVLVIGEISLYRSRGKYHIMKDTSFFDLESIIEKVEINGKIGTKENNRWRGITSYLISDCLSNSNSIVSKLSLDEKNLTRLIVKYNKCRGAEYTEYKISKPWTKFDIGVTLGLSKSEITTDGSGSFSYLDNSYNSIDPSIGVLIAISSPRITEKIALQGELHFLKSNYSSLVELKGSSTQFHDTFIDLTTLSIPLSLKYSFPEKKCGIYLQGGINYDHHLSSNTRLLSEQVSGNIVNTFPETTAFEVNDNQIGYWGGIGILKTYKKLKGSVTIRYFQMSALNKTNGLTANNNRISLNLILFKK